MLELNVWTEAELLHQETSFDEEKKQWSVTVSRKSKEDEQTLQTRQFKVDHIVLATGFGGGKAKMPDKVSGQDLFGGVIVHSSGHGSGASWTGQKALVVGACTSGHDVCPFLLISSCFELTEPSVFLDCLRSSKLRG